MPAYNFKAQWADLVANGLKWHTIRMKRKRATLPGDTVYLYTGMRTKQCRKLGQHLCQNVVPIDIYPGRIVLDGKELVGEEAMGLAIADGFSDLDSFFAFFEKTYGLPQVGTMEVIYWDPNA